MASPDENELLQRRAARLAKPLPAEDDAFENVTPVAQFTLGDAAYAVPLADLCATLALKQVTPVPLAPAHVIGVLRWEGRAITALSLASMLGIRGWRRDPAVLLVLTHGRRLVAVDSEVIPKLVTLPRSAIEVGRTNREGPAVEVLTTGGQTVKLLDTAQVLTMGGIGQ